MPAIIMPRLNYGAIGAINALGLTSGLKLCLDAGDDLSLPAGSATWNDLSGGAYHFNRGTTSGAEGSDPSINGTAGGLSSAEYLGFDGGDWLTLAQANPAWVNNIHKNNAKAAVAAWAYFPSLSVAHTIMGNNAASSSEIGFFFATRTTNILRFATSNGSGGGHIDGLMDSAAIIEAGVWTFVAFLADEAADSGLLQIQDTQETKSLTYTSPSSSNASFTLQISAEGSDFAPNPSGSRRSMIWAWEGTIPTATKLMDLLNITRGRFGV